jgi:hypothetical protein
MAKEAFNKRPVIRDNQLCMTAQEMKDRYLFGVDLTDDDGNGYSKKNIEFQIRSAQMWLQKELPGLLLFPTEIKDERHDYYAQDYVAYNFIKLFKYPVQSVSDLSMQFPLATQVLKFNEEWYRIESVGAQIQLVPTAGTFSSILLSQGGNFLPLFYNGLQNVPSIWSVTYTAGFPKGEIPEDLLNIIGLKASIMPMNIAGDLIAGAGIASKNISLDGLSQGIVTTASAENTGYTANIKQREKEIKSMLEGLKEYYLGIQFAVM